MGCGDRGDDPFPTWGPPMTPETAMLPERPSGPISKVVGLYQTLLRRSLEHFFPDATLETSGDRTRINWDGSAGREHYRLSDEPGGIGLEIEWFGAHYLFQQGSPTPFQ